MRPIALIAALFCLLVSAGELIILFVIPSTAASLTTQGAGSAIAAEQSWALLLMLLLALSASAGVLVSLRRPDAIVWRATVATLVAVAAIVSVGNYAVSRWIGWLGPHEIPWLHSTIVVVGVLYVATLLQRKRT